MLVEILANAAPSGGGSVSGEILVGVIGAIFSGLALLLGKNLGKKEATAARLEEPVPTVPTRKVPGFVTWDHFQPVVKRMEILECQIAEIRKEQGEQYREILESGAAREMRLRDHIDDLAKGIYARINQIADQRPRTRG